MPRLDRFAQHVAELGMCHFKQLRVERRRQSIGSIASRAGRFADVGGYENLLHDDRFLGSQLCGSATAVPVAAGTESRCRCHPSRTAPGKTAQAGVEYFPGLRRKTHPQRMDSATALVTSDSPALSIIDYAKDHHIAPGAVSGSHRPWWCCSFSW